MLNKYFYMHLIYKMARSPQRLRFSVGFLIVIFTCLPALSSNLDTDATNQNSRHIIRFAVVGYPPYTVIDNNQASGFDLEIVHKLARAIEHNVELVKCPWKRCLKLVEQGQLDMLSTAMYTKQRAEYMQYIQPEYLQTSIVFYSKKQKNLSIEKYEDLFGLMVGRELGSATFEPLESDGRITFKDYMKKKQLFNLLLSERIDILVGGRGALDYLAEKHGFTDKVTLQPYQHLGANVYFTVSKKSLLIKHIASLNQAMKKLKEQGVLRALFKQVSTGKGFNRYPLMHASEHQK